MGGSLAPVRVAGFTWNGWQPSAVYAVIEDYCMVESAKVLIYPLVLFVAILILLNVSDLDYHLSPSSFLHVFDLRNHVIVEMCSYFYPMTPHARKAILFHIDLRNNVPPELSIILKFPAVHYTIISLICAVELNPEALICPKVILRTVAPGYHLHTITSPENPSMSMLLVAVLPFSAHLANHIVLE
jgi:hypothetical protein